MWIQIILMGAMAIIAIYLLRSSPTARHMALRRLALLLALTASVVVILAPGWLSSLAHLIGVGRGADLLLYGLVVTFLLYVVNDYKRTAQMNKSIRDVARELTLARAELEGQIQASANNDHAEK